MKVSSGWDQPCHEEESCFDVIHVGAAASTLPDALLAKLKVSASEYLVDSSILF